MSRKSKLKISKACCEIFCLLLCVCLAACSIPNLEKPECVSARQPVKEFYSFHFDAGLKPSPESFERREKFLSDDLRRQLAAQTDGGRDYFTRTTDDYPKAFRIGECQAVNENRTVFQVLLFWKDDTRSEQREVRVEAVRQNDRWLINSVGD